LTASTIAAVALACNHTTPFSTEGYGATQPLEPGNPSQLTYNTGVDTRAAWLPDGSAFFYTQEEIGESDRDRCLALMPGGGGSVIRTICDLSDPADDSLNDFESAAVSPAGVMVYVRTAAVAGLGGAGPDNAALVSAPYTNPLAATVLKPLPYFGPASRAVDMVSDVHWAGPSTIVFLTEQWTYPPACGTCLTVDTVRTGLDIQRLDLAQPPVLSLIANTDQATSVAAGGPDTIYYTLAGDLGVHRRVLTTDADTVVFTFGAVPTDLSVAGSRVAAVVGSTLHVVDLSGGADTPIPVASAVVARPALSPNGRTLVAELGQGGAIDLWMWRLP
jgi:hypothetical protein